MGAPLYCNKTKGIITGPPSAFLTEKQCVCVYVCVWVCVCVSTRMCVCKCVHTCTQSSLFVTPWTAAHQAPQSMGFSRQKYWSGLPFPSTGDLLNPGTKLASPVSLTLAGRFFTGWATEACPGDTEASGKSCLNGQRLKFGFKTSCWLLFSLRIFELPASFSDKKKKHPKEADEPCHSGSLLHLPSKAGPGKNCKAGQLRSF